MRVEVTATKKPNRYEAIGSGLRAVDGFYTFRRVRIPSGGVYYRYRPCDKTIWRDLAVVDAVAVAGQVYFHANCIDEHEHEASSADECACHVLACLLTKIAEGQIRLKTSMVETDRVAHMKAEWEGQEDAFEKALRRYLTERKPHLRVCWDNLELEGLLTLRREMNL